LYNQRNRREKMKEQRPDLFIAEGVEQVMAILHKVYLPEDIRMAALYGSAAKGNFICGLSDINLFLVLSSEAVDTLDRLTVPFRRIALQYRIQTVILSESELERSADIYPVEYLEIRETMKLLCGEDLLSLLLIDRSQYRHQVEERLRGSIRVLRHMLLIMDGKTSAVEEYLTRWCAKQDTLFRAMIRLKDESRLAEAGSEASPITAALTAELYGVDTEVLQEVYAFRDAPDMKRVTVRTINSLLRVYQVLTDTIDRM
jgi:predicted nucleotidyltransferase